MTNRQTLTADRDAIRTRLEQRWSWLQRHPDHPQHVEREIAVLLDLKAYEQAEDALRTEELNPAMSIRNDYGSISIVVRNQLWRDNDMRCFYCGRSAVDLKDATADHVIPMISGGMDATWNLVPCCQSCNSSKGASRLDEWAWSKGFIDRLADIGMPGDEIKRRRECLSTLYRETQAYHDYLRGAA